VTRLVVDVGNTRIKWAQCEDDGTLSAQQAAAHTAWGRADWDRELFAAGGIEQVFAASVAGGEARRALVEAASRHGIAHVRFVESTATACGVRNAYPEPRLLGVDRWVAVIGAHALYAGRACCVVDVGTAATVDTLLADGTHLGGFIVPGPQLMVRSLLTGTSDLAAHTAASPASGRAQFADNTRDAIERGCRVALSALVDRAAADLARIAGTTPVTVVTGGAAPDVLPYVLARVEHVPDLVLHGVARWARQGA
jgi:type III pantothenate kinase